MSRVDWRRRRTSRRPETGPILSIHRRSAYAPSIGGVRFGSHPAVDSGPGRSRSYSPTVSTPAQPGPNDAPGRPARLSRQQVRKIARLAAGTLRRTGARLRITPSPPSLGFMKPCGSWSRSPTASCAQTKRALPAVRAQGTTRRGLPAPGTSSGFGTLRPRGSGPASAVPKVLGESAS